MIYSCGAHIDSIGGISGDIAGDQTGSEVSVTQYYNAPWSGVLRYCGKKRKRVRNRIMKCAYRLARSNKVGYDQSERQSLYNQLSRYNWRLRKLGKVTYCETDCSAFVGCCVNVAMVPLKLTTPINPYIWTGNEREELQKRGFKWVTSGINFTTGEGLLPGDVLFVHNEIRQHTEIFFGNEPSGQLYSISSSTQKTVDEVVNDVIAGAYGDGDERIRRLKKAGYDPEEVQRRVNELWNS